MSSILVVEDDRSTRQLLTEMLKTAGFSVTSAEDGVDALQRLRAGPGGQNREPGPLVWLRRGSCIVCVCRGWRRRRGGSSAGGANSSQR
mgnify:CR=1 FL=1